MKKCKVCGDKTDVIFNVDFKAIPICEGCATSIFLQQAQWYIENHDQKLLPSMEFKSINKDSK